jgi:bifunctional DNase/RNase
MEQEFVKVSVVGVRVEMPSNQPIILLQDEPGQKYLPIWIGAVEATSIAFAQQGVIPARPLTHDLLLEVIKNFGHQIKEVKIISLKDGIFYSEIIFDNGVTISARPSDSIALAIRVEAPILVSVEVLNSAGIEIPVDEQDELDKFRQFLDEVNPEDFKS